MTNTIVAIAKRLKDIYDAPIRIKGLEDDLREMGNRLDAQERRILFLEVFREFHVQAVQRIYDLQDIQENQKRKLANLEGKVENLLALTGMLDKIAPDEDQEEILSISRSLRNHLGRARSRVAAS